MEYQSASQVASQVERCQGNFCLWVDTLITSPIGLSPSSREKNHLSHLSLSLPSLSLPFMSFLLLFPFLPFPSLLFPVFILPLSFPFMSFFFFYFCSFLSLSSSLPVFLSPSLLSPPTSLLSLPVIVLPQHR